MRFVVFLGVVSLFADMLLVPAVLSIATLLFARAQYPRPKDLELARPELEPKGIRGVFWLLRCGRGADCRGLHRLSAHRVSLRETIGRLAADDPHTIRRRHGYCRSISPHCGTILRSRAAFCAPLAFLGGFALAVLGMLLWGMGMGVQESIVRAVLAGMVAADRRAAAYGMFDASYGIAWFLGSALMGILYDRSVVALIIFSVAALRVALPILFIVARRLRLGR